MSTTDVTRSAHVFRRSTAAIIAANRSVRYQSENVSTARRPLRTITRRAHSSVRNNCRGDNINLSIIVIYVFILIFFYRLVPWWFWQRVERRKGVAFTRA